MRARVSPVSTIVAGLVVALAAPGLARSAADVPTTSELSHSPEIVYQGDAYTLTATISPNPGSGTFTFSYPAPGGGTVLVPVAMQADGKASHVLTAVAGSNNGQHIEGWFGGAPGFEGSQDVLFVPLLFPPNTQIHNLPTPTQSTSASIEFSQSTGVTAECRLDGSPWAPCTSPFTASGLLEGSHTFEVRRTDANGRTGQSRSATWPVDLTGPVPGVLQLDDGAPSTNRERHTLYHPATDALSSVKSVRTSRTGALDSDGNLWLDPSLDDSFEWSWESAGPATQYYLDFSGGSGPQTIWVQWFDEAGNASTIESVTVDVRVAWLHLGDAWTSLSPTVPLSISGIDPDEIQSFLVSNDSSYDDEAGVLDHAATFAHPPATWDVTNSAFGGMPGNGLHPVSAQWQDEHGGWSQVIGQWIQVGSEPIPDIVLEDGATTTHDPAIWVAPAPGSDFTIPGWGLTLGYSCDGVNWSQTMSWLPMVGISVTDEHGNCPETDGMRDMHFRWRISYSAWSTVRTASIDLQWDHSLPSDDWLAPTGSVEIDAAADAAASKAGTMAVPPAGGGAVVTPTVTVAVPATDDHTGVTHVRLSNDGITWTTRPYAPTQAWTLLPGSGPRTVWASWRDGANNWTAPVSDTVILDATSPTATTPRLSVATGGVASAGESIPVSVTWTGADIGSGVARYEAAVSVDGGPFTTFATNLSTPAFRRSVSGGHAYRYRVRAIDLAGNVGTWVTSTSFRRILVSDGSSAVRYQGSWRTVHGSSSLGGTERRASDAGATARLTIVGRSVAWIGAVGPSRGKARVYVDGKLVATIDLKAGSAAARRVLWSMRWTSSGSHTVRIKVLGTSRVGVDAFVVLR